MDYTVIEMYERVVEQNRNVQIRLFTPIYEKMIDSAYSFGAEITLIRQKNSIKDSHT